MSPRLFSTVLALAFPLLLAAQDRPVPAGKGPVILDLSRRNLKNFLVDEDARAPYHREGSASADLRDVFTIGSVKAPCAIIWDPLACRLVGVLDIDAAETKPTDPDHPYLAAGPFPFAKTAGVSGTPRYFGFRLVAGVPEFLYTCGSVSFEERLWLEQGGAILLQRFAVKDHSQEIRFVVPEPWKGRVSASAGTWKGNILTVSKEEASEFVLSYPLLPAPEESQPDKRESD